MSNRSHVFLEFALRTAVLAGIWWIISAASSASWAVGLPVVIIAALLSTRLQAEDELRVRMIPLLKFIPFFLFESARGGIDVARRAYSPRLPLAPGFVRYPTRLPAGPSRTFFACCVSLLPGTLSARIDEHALQLHVLDNTSPLIEQLNILEAKVAGIFGTDSDKKERRASGEQA